MVIMAPFSYLFYYTCILIGVTDFQVSHVDPKSTCLYCIVYYVSLYVLYLRNKFLLTYLQPFMFHICMFLHQVICCLVH